MNKSNHSAVGRALRLLIVTAVCVLLGLLAYGWSLNETEKFSILIFGEQYAIIAALVVQFGPQALLAIPFFVRGSKTENLRIAAIIGALALNFIDTLTNVGAYLQWQSITSDATLHPFVQTTAYYTGFLAAFLITWAEEAVMLLISVALGIVYELGNDFGIRLPKSLATDAQKLTRQMAGAGALSRRQQPNSQPAVNTTRPATPPNLPVEPRAGNDGYVPTYSPRSGRQNGRARYPQHNRR